MADGSEIRERVFRFACDVLALNDKLKGIRGTSDIAKQLIRSATSIGANLEEADAAQSRADFINKCSISLKEAREAHYWLRLLRSSNKIGPSYDALVIEADRVVAVLTSIVKNSTGSRSEIRDDGLPEGEIRESEIPDGESGDEGFHDGKT